MKQGRATSCRRFRRCLTVRRVSATCQAWTAPTTRPSFCFLAPETGDCGDRGVRWFHNAKAGTCLQFTYGGCAGNENRFVIRKDNTFHWSNLNGVRNKTSLQKMEPFETYIFLKNPYCLRGHLQHPPSATCVRARARAPLPFLYFILVHPIV